MLKMYTLFCLQCPNKKRSYFNVLCVLIILLNAGSRLLCFGFKKKNLTATKNEEERAEQEEEDGAKEEVEQTEIAAQKMKTDLIKMHTYVGDKPAHVIGGVCMSTCKYARRMISNGI